MRAAGGDVALDVVVAVDEPVSRWRRVGREADKVLACVRAEVAGDHVLGLNAVLDKERVAPGLEGDIVLDAQVVHPVDGNRAVVRVVDRAAANV